MVSLLAIATLSTMADFQLTVTNSHNVVNFLTTLQIGAVNAVNWTILNITCNKGQPQQYGKNITRRNKMNAENFICECVYSMFNSIVPTFWF